MCCNHREVVSTVNQIAQAFTNGIWKSGAVTVLQGNSSIPRSWRVARTPRVWYAADATQIPRRPWKVITPEKKLYWMDERKKSAHSRNLVPRFTWWKSNIPVTLTCPMVNKLVKKLFLASPNVCCACCLSQNGSAGWTDEADSNRGRGEASRDFAKVSIFDI